MPGIWSSRPNAWSAHLAVQLRRFSKPPELDRASMNHHACRRVHFHTLMHAWRSPPKSIKRGILASAVSQSLTPELSTTLDLAETSVLDYAWHVVPFAGKNHLVLFAYLSVVEELGGSRFALTVVTAITLPPFTESGEVTLAC